MNETEISERLFKFAERHAASLKVHFGEGAKYHVRQRTDNAAREVLAQSNGRNEGIETLVVAAEASFQRLVDGMIAARKSIPFYEERHLDTIGEETFFKALQSLCPIAFIC